MNLYSDIEQSPRLLFASPSLDDRHAEVLALAESYDGAVFAEFGPLDEGGAPGRYALHLLRDANPDFLCLAWFPHEAAADGVGIRSRVLNPQAPPDVLGLPPARWDGVFLSDVSLAATASEMPSSEPVALMADLRSALTAEGLLLASSSDAWGNGAPDVDYLLVDDWAPLNDPARWERLLGDVWKAVSQGQRVLLQRDVGAVPLPAVRQARDYGLFCLCSALLVARQEAGENLVWLCYQVKSDVDDHLPPLPGSSETEPLDYFEWYETVEELGVPGEAVYVSDGVGGAILRRDFSLGHVWVNIGETEGTIAIPQGAWSNHLGEVVSGESVIALSGSTGYFIYSGDAR